MEKILSPELQNNLLKLEEIKSLKRDWNGNNAKPVPRKIINKTKTILINLDRQPQIFPTANDSIQIEYDGENKSYLELQVTKKNMLSFYKVDKSGKETEGAIPVSSSSINTLVEEFFA